MNNERAREVVIGLDSAEITTAEQIADHVAFALEHHRGERGLRRAAWAREVDERRAIDAGFDCHLTKPVSVDVLETLLNTSTVQKLRHVR